jgi:hypothetical protein
MRNRATLLLANAGFEVLITCLLARELMLKGRLFLMRLISVVVIIATLALAGCKDTDTTNGNGNGTANRVSDFKPPPPIKPTQAVDPAFKPCNPYFPLVPGSVAKYVLNYSSGMTADVTVIVDAADEGGRKVFTQQSQIIDRSGGLQFVQSIVRKFVCNGDKVEILSETTDSTMSGRKSASEFEYRENSLIMPGPDELLRKGSTWSHTLRAITRNPGEPPQRSDVPTVIKFESAGVEDVTTAAGKFKAVKVIRTVGENGTIDFYAAGIGLVRRFAKEGTSWELKEYSGLTAQN